ncbi:unnamed protein product [Citrullus colocynthis]|uniref:Uncharacterized protein n=1 Tax=Citrullus colocynthis TaxID=252529 RepID=A0ABP0Y6B8_9ROSI
MRNLINKNLCKLFTLRVPQYDIRCFLLIFLWEFFIILVSDSNAKSASSRILSSTQFRYHLDSNNCGSWISWTDAESREDAFSFHELNTISWS